MSGCCSTGHCVYIPTAGRRREEYSLQPWAGRISLQVRAPTRGPEWLLLHHPSCIHPHGRKEKGGVQPIALGWKDFPAGCTGALARELAREYPRLQVTVFDLPDIVELAVHFQPAGPQAAQIHFAAGDFFRDPLPSAELYVLCRILHNWSDDKVHKLLSKVAESCKPGESPSSRSLFLLRRRVLGSSFTRRPGAVAHTCHPSTLGG
ncbi:uncharacterized protein LOC113223070 [Piliocolobus tephrosceles]|uniref:uncharacterized protein LOC113223070 n=1 Tax=Piliocolobus tephrosceles TaxID=591936 RepID=UPI000E6AF32A|nr:uncharacterized protein LOC113223070 [Piliocolobus tephrosceles]